MDELPPDCSSSTGHSRTIVHIDADCFYAQVEMLRNPSLVDKPLGIQQKNIVVTCNYKAREFGVKKLMFIKDAQKLCPALVLVSGEDLTHYRAMSDKVTDLLQSKFSPLVERLGLDENFIDVTKLVESRATDPGASVEGHEYSCTESEVDAVDCPCGCDQRMRIGSIVAAEMRRALREELGLTTCAGVSYNKVLAKLVGSKHKPNQQTILYSWQALNLISSLPGGLRSIPGIGRQTSDLLKAQGIVSLEDLQNCDLSRLTRIFSNRDKAQLVQRLSFGIDDSAVKPSGKPKSIGIEDAFKDISTVSKAEEKIKILATRLLELLVSQEEKRQPSTVKLTVRKILQPSKEWRRESRQTSMFPLPPINTENFVHNGVTRLMPLLMDLFGKMVGSGESFHLTLLGVAFANFSDRKVGAGSISSFFQPASKRAKVDEQASSSLNQDLPPGVDPEVFNTLPPDIQSEILAEFKNNVSVERSGLVKKKK